MNKTLLLSVAVLTLAGCSSIEQPVPQIQLVESSKHHIDMLVSAQLGSALDSVATDENITFNNRSYSALPAFYAASGRLCRFISNSNTRALFCKSEQDGWFKVPDVLSDLQTSQIGGIE